MTFTVCEGAYVDRVGGFLTRTYIDYIDSTAVLSPDLRMVESKGEVQTRVDMPRALAAEAQRCRRCGGGLLPSYFRISGLPVCAPCRVALGGSWPRVCAYALVAGALGAAVYYAVLAVLGVRFVLSPVLAGVLVGIAVSRGAGVDRLLGQRLFAMLITYIAAAGTYTHSVFEMQGVAGLNDAVRQALVLPLAMAIQGKNWVSLILLGLGLHEAFRFAAPTRTSVQGPFMDGGIDPDRDRPSEPESAA